MLRWVVAAALVLMPTAADGRSPAVVREYRAQHACPATHQFKGACPGFVVDHIVPLCAGGRDHPDNMIWQSKAESLAKDKAEWEMCRWIRKMKARKAEE